MNTAILRKQGILNVLPTPRRGTNGSWQKGKIIGQGRVKAKTIVLGWCKRIAIEE